LHYGHNQLYGHRLDQRHQLQFHRNGYELSWYQQRIGTLGSCHSSHSTNRANRPNRLACRPGRHCYLDGPII
jgi:hypothetical protein